MLAAIINQLKTGRIENVVPYGSEEHPAPPYIVVRQDKQTFRIFVHFLPGQQVFLREFFKSDLSLLLDFKLLTDASGNRNKVLPSEEYTDIIISNDDGTISMERRYMVPSWISLPGGS